METMHSIPRRRKALFYGISILITILLPVLFVEAYVRVTQKNIDLWEKTGRKIGRNPMSAWASVDAFCAYRAQSGNYGRARSVQKTVNSHGHISTPEITPSKPKDVLRVAFLGGSSTAGTGHILADRQTWPWLASERLMEGVTDKRIEFINGALGGYSSFESYGRFWSRIRYFSPDIVVFYHGWNEMYYFNTVDYLWRWRTLPDGSWTFDRTQQRVGTHKPYLVDYLLRTSQVLTRLRLFYGKREGGEIGPTATLKAPSGPRPGALRSGTLRANLVDGEPRATYDPRALEVWRTNLRLMKETAEILGVTLFVAKQPTLIVQDLPAEQRRRCRYDYHGFGHEAHVRAFDDLYRVISEEFPEDRIIDLTPLSGKPEYFHDHVHPSVQGAKAIAEMVSETLIEYLKVSRREVSPSEVDNESQPTPLETDEPLKTMADHKTQEPWTDGPRSRGAEEPWWVGVDTIGKAW